MNQSKTSKFGKLQAFIWPIHKSEHKKFIPILVLFFLISFNYNLLRAVKDSFVVTASSCGAETIPFIKTWAILPMALFMTFLFTRLSNRFSREKVFYLMMGLFLGFFLIFGLFLYPISNVLQPNKSADFLQSYLPGGFRGLIAIFRIWPLTLFYVMSELWGVIILTMMFWGFTNYITSMNEAKRFYSLFAIGANISGVFSGQAAVKITSNLYNPIFPIGNNAWDQSVAYLCLVIVLIGLASVLLFRWYNKNIISLDEVTSLSIRKKSKIKMSLRDSFSYLFQSRYLIYVALLVLTYNITINIVEVLWKNQLKELYPNPQEYAGYMGQVITSVGIIATFIAIFISGNSLRKLGWTVSAMVPPLIMFLTGAGFFSLLLLKDSYLIPFAAIFHSSPLNMCIFFGSLHNCLCRASKYTFFDATKELAFVPLSEESKMKGKAAIDGVGSRIGKSGGAFIFQVMLLLFGSLTPSIAYIAIVFFIITFIWAASVLSLGKQFQSYTAEPVSIKEQDEDTTLSKTEESQAASLK